MIKALDDQSIKTDLVSGASILGDGRVVLILNLIALVERFAGGREKSVRAEGLLSMLRCLGCGLPKCKARLGVGHEQTSARAGDRRFGIDAEVDSTNPRTRSRN